MALASTTYHDALWEAAKDLEIPDDDNDSCWPLLKMFLKGKSIDHTKRSEVEWKKSLRKRRRLLNRELAEDKGKGGKLALSPESER